MHSVMWSSPVAIPANVPTVPIKSIQIQVAYADFIRGFIDLTSRSANAEGAVNEMVC